MRNTESAERHKDRSVAARTGLAASVSSLIARPDLRRTLAAAGGLAFFLGLYLVPFSGSSTDPFGNTVLLTREGRGAIGLLFLAIIWWGVEAAPIGITALAIGMFQALFGLRPAAQVFRDYMDPSVQFIFGSVVTGIALSKSGLARRAVYTVLALAGERCGAALFGCMAVTAGLAHFMPHTAAAACIFPVLLSVNHLHGEGGRPNRFGKALFIGMAYAAAAGSIATMLGSARTPASMAMFREYAGADISFFDLSRYMLPVSWFMVVLIWAYLCVVYGSDHRELSGLRESTRGQLDRMGPVSRGEWTIIALLACTLGAMLVQPLIPALHSVDKAGIFLVATVLFFLTRVLTVRDLEEVPWNIILLYGGALSMSFCLWQTGAAGWLSIQAISLFGNGRFAVLCMVLLTLVTSNLIMNVAVLAAVIPVVVAGAKYSGIHPEPLFYACMAAAGMPLILRIGSAPNAIAFESRQFSEGEFFRHGLAVSIMLIMVILAAAAFIWPLHGLHAVQ